MSPDPSPLSLSIRSTIRRSPVSWAHACGIALRPYQVQIARAIKDSVLHRLGLTFVVILPRQSGKNEVQALRGVDVSIEAVVVARPDLVIGSPAVLRGRLGETLAGGIPSISAMP